ncbi:VWA domain-containing protein [Devosia algicola]|uniref:VWA domain-containing protein n=1 Tax=Devosia algicola TaxID=3026418 RepID=A0ABY7YTK1_9HYPH|nr:VWA domain-containing protein [Devosia algicola]WDR04185.1 VWA domain-containing protein [Devosia algicola]
MDLRITVGAAALALILAPLGYQLYSSTALTPPKDEPVGARTTGAPAPESEAPAISRLQEQDARAKTEPTPTATPTPAPAEAVVSSEPRQARKMAADSGAMNDMAAPAVELAKPSAAESMGFSNTVVAAPSGSVAVYGGAVAPTQLSGDSFASFDESPVKLVSTDPVSTFSIDVDTASYSYVRRMLEDGMVPPPDAVRIEEMLNYFPYDYAAPESAAMPFKPSIGIYPAPWSAKNQIVQIGIKGYVPPATSKSAANLVFLIDTSGSMDAPDKLPLLKRAFGLLLDQLSSDDTVAIVTYAGSAGVALEPTSAGEKSTILASLDRLAAGGSTAGADGIELAYQLAEEHKLTDGTNRVILATDGDFNVGISDPDDLEDFIKTQRQSGISLSVLGFGRGNLDDATMQALAQNGNGNASYISNFKEARKVLVSEVGGTLQTIAQDVKIQVEFNPAMVSEYRLIGYETRALNREDFNNDAVDAGDIGAGHTVTALYEITPAGSGGGLVDPLRYENEQAPSANTSDEIGFLKMRYKLPGEQVSQLIEQSITPDLVYDTIEDAPTEMRFAASVAAFGQKLKGSQYGAMDWDAIRSLSQSGRGAIRTAIGRNS